MCQVLSIYTKKPSHATVPLNRWRETGGEGGGGIAELKI